MTSPATRGRGARQLAAGVPAYRRPAHRVAPLGPLMVGIAGLELDEVERELLCHPCVGGVILFSRNYRSREQLRALCDAIHALREPPLLVATDHEGGRVQRFRDGFTDLPAAARYGALHDRDPGLACRIARAGGRVMAGELRAAGVDFSFAPVLDLDHGTSAVIGERAFHRAPEVVTALARAYLTGMRDAGVSGVGKHFPGHGGVEVDSHTALPVDHRSYEDLRRTDIVPFEQLAASELAGMMPAHVVFECLDARSAGFSGRWISDVLRGEMRFRGVVFSDDLGMTAAAAGGNHVQRARAALEAGCDMVLACNDREAAIAVVDALRFEPDPEQAARLARMRGRGTTSFEQLARDAAYRSAVIELASLNGAQALGPPDDDRCRSPEPDPSRGLR